MLLSFLLCGTSLIAAKWLPFASDRRCFLFLFAQDVINTVYNSFLFLLLLLREWQVNSVQNLDCKFLNNKKYIKVCCVSKKKKSWLQFPQQKIAQ